jgi:hypothetical protein
MMVYRQAMREGITDIMSLRPQDTSTFIDL